MKNSFYTKFKNIIKFDEAGLRNIITSVPGAVFRCAADSNWTMEFISDGIEELTGYSPSDFINNKVRSFSSLIHPEDRKEVEEICMAAVAEKNIYNVYYRLQRQSGDYIWVHERGQGVFDENGSLLYLGGVIIDITEQKKVQREFNIQKAHFESLFTNNLDAIAYFDMNENIFNINASFTKLFGYELEEVKGKNINTVIDPFKYISDYMSPRILKGESLDWETVRYDKTGRPLNVLARGGPLKVDGKIVGGYMIYSDNTERYQANERLKQSERKLALKNKELEDFIYISSHDLRTPLVNIQGFSQRLEKLIQRLTEILDVCEVDGELKEEIAMITNEKIPKALQYIFASTDKMDTLIKSLLKISRIGKVEMDIQKIDMNQLIENIIRSIEFQLKETGSEILFEELPYCYGDKNLLNQLFSNIINNAIKYRSNNRKLIINIDGEVKKNTVIYRVKDNGRGIENRYLEKIWDVFYRIDPHNSVEGEGIGLSIVKNIVEKHYGNTWVESKADEGSIFYIELSRKEFTEWYYYGGQYNEFP